MLRRRSRALLASLLGPYRRLVAVIFTLIVVAQLAALAGPWLVGIGIDRIPQLEKTRDAGPMALIIVAFALYVLSSVFWADRWVRRRH